nr:coiled-coil domain-containing 194 splice variant L.Gg [synthetic construct]
MDPTVPRATLKAMGLCTLLVLLVAAVTAAVAVLLWRSEALGKLRGCRERAANESRALELRVAQLERERDRLQRMADERGREEDALRRELSRVRKDGEKLSSGLRSCRERAARMETNITALQDEVRGLRRERAELSRRNAALQEELAQGAERALGLQRRLEETAEQRRALRARGERCEERQRDLEAMDYKDDDDKLRDRTAELDALQRRLGPRTARRRCSPSRYSAWVLRCLSALFLFGVGTLGRGLVWHSVAARGPSHPFVTASLRGLTLRCPLLFAGRAEAPQHPPVRPLFASMDATHRMAPALQQRDPALPIAPSPSSTGTSSSSAPLHSAEQSRHSTNDPPHVPSCPPHTTLSSCARCLLAGGERW